MGERRGGVESVEVKVGESGLRGGKRGWGG